MGAQKSQHSAGWYAGALLFWLLSAWLITVGLSSIIPQIFWPNGDAQSHEASCSAALRELRRELLTRTSYRISHPAPLRSPTEPRSSTTPVPSSRDELLAWFEGWDKRLFEARPSCREPERAAWTELGRLRHGMQALIERFEREEAPRIQRLEQLLGRDRADVEARAPACEPGQEARAPACEPGQEARAHIPRKTTQHE